MHKDAMYHLTNIQKTGEAYRKAIEDAYEYEFTRPCFCIGPQNGEAVCPCQMRIKSTEGNDPNLQHN